MQTLEAVVGWGRDDASHSLKSIIKPHWKQRRETSPFTARCGTKPEVPSKHNGNACALTTVKTWLYLNMQIQPHIVWDLLLVNEKMADIYYRSIQCGSSFTKTQLNWRGIICFNLFVHKLWVDIYVVLKSLFYALQNILFLKAVL